MNENTNHIDNRLRQLENQSLPDLSQQEAHWQQLRSMMQGTAQIEPPGPMKRNRRWLAAACVAALLLAAGYTLLNPSKQEGDHFTFIFPQTIIRHHSPVKDTVVISRQENNNIVVKKKPVTPTIIQPVQRDTQELFVSGGSIIEGPKTTLAGFFKQMEKPEQSFVINPARDTVITGHNGSTFMIRANTFNTSLAVTLVLKEFYSYGDMITNKLSTMSNGRQLVSGGMIYLKAMAEGKQVEISSGKSIRWFIPDTSAAMKGMQIFEGQQCGDIVLPNTGRDTSINRCDGDINWVPQDRFFNTNYLTKMVKVLDLRDNPVRTKGSSKGKVGVFYIARDPKVSKQQLEDELKTKYGYAKVKIKTQQYSPKGVLGDSVWIEAATARQYNLAYKDSVVTNYPTNGSFAPMFYVYDVRGRKRSKSVANAPYPAMVENTAINNLAERYSVDISKLGWINCDRFYNDTRPKIAFQVDLQDTAGKYYTLLVFDRIKSMMTGSVKGNHVLFQNVPEGETVRVVSVGIKNGRPVTAVETVQLSRTIYSGLKFEETNPAAFQQQASTLDK